MKASLKQAIQVCEKYGADLIVVGQDDQETTLVIELGNKHIEIVTVSSDELNSRRTLQFLAAVCEG